MSFGSPNVADLLIAEAHRQSRANISAAAQLVGISQQACQEKIRSEITQERAKAQAWTCATYVPLPTSVLQDNLASFHWN